MTAKSNNQEVVISVDQFSTMTSSEIVQVIKKNPNYRITGEIVGQNRCIIKEVKK